jgi:hypothetical protein
MSAIVCVTSYGFGTNASPIPTCLVGAFPDVRMTGMSGYLSRSVSASCSPSSEPGVWISENTRSTCSPALIYVSASSARSASITLNPASRNSSAKNARTKTSSSTTRIRAGRDCSSWPDGTAAAVEGPSGSDLEPGNQTAPCRMKPPVVAGSSDLRKWCDDFLCGHRVAA